MQGATWHLATSRLGWGELGYDTVPDLVRRLADRGRCHAGREQVSAPLPESKGAGFITANALAMCNLYATTLLRDRSLTYTSASA